MDISAIRNLKSEIGSSLATINDNVSKLAKKVIIVFIQVNLTIGIIALSPFFILSALFFRRSFSIIICSQMFFSDLFLKTYLYVVGTKPFKVKDLTDTICIGEIKHAKLLIEAGIELNGNSRYNDPLYEAVVNQENYEIAELLLEKGSRPIHIKPETLTTLIRSNKLKLVKLLIEAGIELNGNSRCNDPLYEAVVNQENYEIAELLLEKGSRPIHIEAEDIADLIVEDKRRIAKLLVENGAPVDIPPTEYVVSDGKRPILKAIEKQDYEMLE